MEYYDKEKVLYLADPFRKCGVDAIKEHNLKAKLLPETEAIPLIQAVVLNFSEKNYYTSPFYTHLKASNLECQDASRVYAKSVVFDNVWNPSRSEWLKSFRGEAPFIVWRSYHWIKTVFACEDIPSLVKIVDEAWLAELYISNYQADFVIALSDSRFIRAYGQVAIDWLQGCIDEYNKTDRQATIDWLQGHIDEYKKTK